jgi:hypothetical protein
LSKGKTTIERRGGVEADDGDRAVERLRHGVLLVWLPLASLSLTG